METLDLKEAFEQEGASPLLVEFWAPWCAPCRMMAPALEQMTQEFAGQVRVQKLNADENAEILRSLNVMAIPTLIGFRDGTEVVRRTGAQSPQALHAVFQHLASNEPLPKTAKLGMDSTTRMLRLVSGLIVAMMAVWVGNWLLLAAGGLILFWGVHDRCPIWQALVRMFQQEKSR